MVTGKRKSPDIVDVLKGAGYGVVEGKDAVLAKIEELAVPKQGAELLLEAIAEPTLNRYLDGNPKVTFKSEEDWQEFVKILQKKRAMFITAEQKKREPKVEGEDDGE